MGNNKYIYPQTPRIWCSVFLWKTQVFFWYHFTSASRTPFRISCNAGLLAIKSHFCLCSVILFPTVDSPFHFCLLMVTLQCIQSCGVFVFCSEFVMVFCRRISSIWATPLLLEAANILRCQKSFKYSKDILGHVTLR